MDERVREKIEQLAENPGIYVFRDGDGRTLYVGKATNLRDRVRTYFAPGQPDKRYFVERLESEVADIETILTRSEKEAVLLENTLIKERRPLYNARLRDDKDFLFVKVDLEAPWPKLEMVRRPKPERRASVKLFGPFHSARSARSTMLLASRHFKLRTCTDSSFQNRSRPCLLYQMGRCPGPCVYDVDRDAYLEQVTHATLFLAGRHAELVTTLRQKMAEASAAMAYERAAQLRDQIKAVEATLAEQHVVQVADVDQDVMGLHRADDLVQLVVVQVRAGKVTGKREFHWNGQELLADDGDLLSSVVVQYYEQQVEQIPDEVVLPVELPDVGAVAELLTERRGRKVAVVTPRRGHRAALVELAQKNAEHLASQRRGSNADSEARLQGVADRLGLAGPPRTIECFDIAHHQSGKAVAAMAVLVDGSSESSRTRSFTIKRAKTGDDYGGLYEVLARRFRRAKQGEAGWELPDLLVVDGGRGQLAVAQAALGDAELPGPVPALAGLAKERAARRSPFGELLKEETVERVYLPNRVNPIAIRGTSPLLLLCQARDEAHRLAGKQLAHQRRARAFGSELDEIPGVGPTLRRALLRHLGSIEAVRAASRDALAAVPGVGPALAARIHEHFNGPAAPDEPAARPAKSNE